MQYSLISLVKAPYNKGNILFTLYRFFIWIFIQLFRIKNYQFNIWGNRKIFLNYSSLQCMWLMHNYWVDWEEYNLIKDIVKENDIVFDVGANIGLYTLWMSKFNTSGCIHCFEPDTNNFNILKKNIELNKLNGQIRLNKMGVADHTGFLYFTNNLDMQNHLTEKKSDNAIEIPVITLDEYCQKLSIAKIKYLKIDIEGFELSALKGTEKLLSHGLIDIIQLEINNTLSNSGVSSDKLINHLKIFGYQLAKYNVDDKKLEPIQFTAKRDNYFAIRSIDILNGEIKKHEDNLS